jgi:cell fate regulator YaaT (PSP1 superfamily)
MKSCRIRVDRHVGLVEVEAPDDVQRDDWVVAEMEKGPSLAQVVSGPEETEKTGLRKITRKVTADEVEQFRALKDREQHAFAFCKRKIADMGLAMKLLSAEFLFGGSKLLFYFVSENRVDFRELVKELAKEFKVRIELRQVGVRDESKMIGGLGSCGNVACCRRFLTNFSIVSIKMVKEQGLALNPSKISGICGRLMCCLSYEHEMYAQFKKDFPKVGKRVATRFGDGKVVKHNTLYGTFAVQLDDGKEMLLMVKDLLVGVEASPRPPEAPAKGGRSADGAGGRGK